MRGEAGQLTVDPRAAPLLAAVREAAAARRRVLPRGAGSWWPDLPAGMVPLTGAPTTLDRFDPTDLVATAGAAMPLAELRAVLAAGGAFVALDPPGTHRTLGGALAAASAGPLAAGYGPPRDQVLGMTFVTGNGHGVKSGGRVVKNVAGFDLAKVVVGGFGSFGCIADVHLRLRALPPADRTLAWSAPAAAIGEASRQLLLARVTPVAFEAVSPPLAARLDLPDAWALLVRAVGAGIAVGEELDAASAVATPLCGEPRAAPQAWDRWPAAVGASRALLRIGADPASWPDAVALAGEFTGTAELVTVTVPRGTVRLGLGDVTAAALARLREALARRGWPVTLERAPAELLAAAGVWGALPDQARALAERVRAAFDPNDVFGAPLWGGRAVGR